MSEPVLLHPALAFRHSVFSRLFIPVKAVCGSAGLAPNAADGFGSHYDDLPATELPLPSRLSPFPHWKVAKEGYKSHIFLFLYIGLP